MKKQVGKVKGEDGVGKVIEHNNSYCLIAEHHANGKGENYHDRKSADPALEHDQLFRKTMEHSRAAKNSAERAGQNEYTANLKHRAYSAAGEHSGKTLVLRLEAEKHCSETVRKTLALGKHCKCEGHGNIYCHRPFDRNPAKWQNYH